MFKVVSHYESPKPMTVETTPERDTANKLATLNHRDIDCVATFTYEDTKLLGYTFCRA